MRRRQFFGLLGAAAAWPMAARAQQPATPMLGFLHLGSAEDYGTATAAFRKGLSEAGYSEGRNVTIEYRWAQGQRERLPGLMADLVRRRPAVIVAMPSSGATAAKAGTTTVPIIFWSQLDPIQIGLVTSLSRPEGNVTGINSFGGALGPKRMQLARELAPNAVAIGLMVNPNNLNFRRDIQDLEETALAIGQRLVVVEARSEPDIEAGFKTLAQEKAGALIIVPDVLFFRERAQLVTLAARHSIQAIYENREFVAAGGLMSYGSNQADSIRQAGIYAGRILKGDKPADLPVIQSAKFELVVNLKTARVMGFEVPTSILLRADEVIE